MPWINNITNESSETRPSRVRLPDGSTLTNEEVTNEVLSELGWLWQNPLNKKLKPIITRLAFRLRFSKDEKIAIEMASIDNPYDTEEERYKSAFLRSYIKDVDSANYIDLSRGETRNGVELLETYGLLVSGRAKEILDTEPTKLECPEGIEIYEIIPEPEIISISTSTVFEL